MISITPKFKNFIISLLQRVELSKKNIESFTDEESMMLFRKAFVHRSYNSEWNYEELEYKGDTVVNLAMTQYLRQRFPRIISVKWLTKIKHNLSSKTFLAGLSIKGRFFDHILYGTEIDNIVKVGDPRNNLTFISMMEDTFEAFIGALTKVIDKKTSRGIGYAVSYKMVASFCDREEISLDWEDVFDAKTRLKELYDVLEWGDLSLFINTQYNSIRKAYASTISGHLAGVDKPRSVIATEHDVNDKNAEEKAAAKTLDILIQLGKNEEIESPYIEMRDESDTTEVPPIPKKFKEFITGLLRASGMIEESIPDFTDELSLSKFRMSLIHVTYHAQINHNLYKFEGVTISDLCISDYIQSRFPAITSEKWLSRLKHTITSNENRVIADIAIKAGFEDYVVYGERIEESLQKYPPEKNAEYRNMLKATFMSFIGAMTMIVDSKRVKGVGYTLAYNLYEYYLDDADISTDYNVIFDAKSRLSELYLRLGWATRKYVFSTYDEEKCLYKSEVIGYPKGNKVPNEKNKMVLGRGEAKRKTEAEKIAARVTLKKLDRTFHISEVPIDPS